MKRILLAALVLSLNFTFAFAQETCGSRAVSKEGKPLAGAPKASFLKKCKRDTCQAKAVGSDGRLSALRRKASCKNASGRRSGAGARTRGRPSAGSSIAIPRASEPPG